MSGKVSSRGEGAQNPERKGRDWQRLQFKEERRLLTGTDGPEGGMSVLRMG